MTGSVLWQMLCVIFFKKVGGDLMQDKIPVSWDLSGLVYCALDDLGIG